MYQGGGAHLERHLDHADYPHVPLSPSDKTTAGARKGSLPVGGVPSNISVSRIYSVVETGVLCRLGLRLGMCELVQNQTSNCCMLFAILDPALLSCVSTAVARAAV